MKILAIARGTEGVIVGKARILVVEDDGVTALALKTALTKAGYDVSGVVDSGEDAVRLSTGVLS